MKRRLLVEGPDDENVIGNILYNHSLDSVFEFKQKRSVDTLINTLADELEATDIVCLGAVLDIDDSRISRWGRVSHALTKAGYTSVPLDADANGTVVTEEGLPPVGIWLMPDNITKGAIEHFLSAFIKPTDSLWPKAQSDVAAIPAASRLFKDVHTMKASIHTWLAWQEEPGIRMGQVFKREYLDAKHPRASQFVSWINRLLAVIAPSPKTA